MSTVKIEKIVPEFQPLKLTITIENETELKFLKQITEKESCDYWNADMIDYEPTDDEEIIIDNLLSNINNALEE